MSVLVVGNRLGLYYSKTDDKDVNANGRFFVRCFILTFLLSRLTGLLSSSVFVALNNLQKVSVLLFVLLSGSESHAK